MKRLFASVLALALLAGAAFSQEDTSPEKQKVPAVLALASGNKAEGIELPPDTKVANDEGFVSIQAICKGQVKFIVIASQGTRVKYITNEVSNTIIVSIPPQGGVISVYAIGLVDGKLTDPVRTVVQIGTPLPVPTPPSPTPPTPTPPAPTPPTPTPPTPTPPAPVVGPLNVTFVLDLNSPTPALARVLNSQTLRKAITDNGNFFRIYGKDDAAVKRTGMDKVLQQVGGSNVMIVQRSDGSLAVTPIPIPGTEAEVIAKVREAGGIK